MDKRQAKNILESVLNRVNELEKESHENPDLKALHVLDELLDIVEEDKDGTPSFSHPSIEEVVLKNPLILSGILYHLPPQLLLRCRLVSSLWCKISTQYLFTSHSLQITLNCPDNFKTFFKYNPSSYIPFKDGDLTLENLTTLLGKSDDRFPCTNFSFNIPPGQSSSPRKDGFLNFFLTHGQHIRKLTFIMTPSSSMRQQDSINIETIGYVLENHLPFLESLTLDSFPRNLNNGQRFFPQQNPSTPVVLINLKSLTFLNFEVRDHRLLIKDLFIAAINLQEVRINGHGLDIDFFPLLCSTHRTEAVKGLQFYPTVREYSESLPWFERFSNLPVKPQLTEIMLTNHVCLCMPNAPSIPRCCKVLSDILNKNKQVLKKVEVHGTIHCLPHVDWPALTAVNKFKIVHDDYSRQCDTVLPKNLQFDQTFPNVQQVWITGSPKCDLVPSKSNIPFGNVGTVCKSIQRLLIDSEYPMVWLEEFPSVFPEVEYLEFCYSKILMPVVLGWRELRHLVLIFEMGQSPLELPVGEVKGDASQGMMETNEASGGNVENPDVIPDSNTRQLNKLTNLNLEFRVNKDCVEESLIILPVLVLSLEEMLGLKTLCSFQKLKIIFDVKRTVDLYMTKMRVLEQNIKTMIEPLGAYFEVEVRWNK